MSAEEAGASFSALRQLRRRRQQQQLIETAHASSSCSPPPLGPAADVLGGKQAALDDTQLVHGRNLTLAASNGSRGARTGSGRRQHDAAASMRERRSACGTRKLWPSVAVLLLLSLTASACSCLLASLPELQPTNGSRAHTGRAQAIEQDSKPVIAGDTKAGECLLSSLIFPLFIPLTAAPYLRVQAPISKVAAY